MKRNLFAIALALMLVTALVFVVAPTAKAETVTLTDGATLNITEDTVLDLAGNSGTVNVTGGVKLSVYDSANTGVTGKGAGKLTVNGKVEIEATDAAGRRFMAVQNDDDGTYSFHPFFVGIQKVGVNTDKNALCLKAIFVTNAIAQEKIETGIFYGTTPDNLPKAVDTFGAFSFEDGVMEAYFDLMGSLDSQEAIDASRSFQAYIKIGDKTVTNKVYTVTPSYVVSELDKIASDFADAQKEKMVNMIKGKTHLEALCPNFLHVHDYEAVVTAPTCNKAGVITYTCACGDVYTEAGEPATGNHTDENSDYKCDVCSTKVLPADGTALTVPQALAIAKLGGSSYTTEKYYITGIVTNVYNTTYGNFYIKDAEGNQICIYGLYQNGTRYDAMSYKPVEGDEITVYTVLGTYNSKPQGKNAELDEVFPHEHDYKSVVTEAGCLTEGYTTHTCSICNSSHVDSKVEALGHTTDNGECERCGQTIGGDAPVIGTLAEFTFGANGSASHVDGNDLGTSKSYTAGAYTLNLTGMSKVYGTAYDAKGNSCIKLGTSKVIGAFSFTVPDNVTEVEIYVAKYKAKTTKINVNGTAYTISGSSDNGAYDKIVIDTTSTKTITFKTVSGGIRAMVNTIVFNGYAQ